MKELTDLKDKIISLPNSSSEKTRLALFQKDIENPNDLENSNLIESKIDTDERERLWNALCKLGTLIGSGLNEHTDYIDDWRTW